MQLQLSGYILLHRKLLEWGWYQDNVVKGLFLHLLLTASFKEFDWQGKTFPAGTVITGRKQLAADLGFSEQQIRTALKKLESTKEVVVTSSTKYTVIKIMKWQDYQVPWQYESDKTSEIVNKLLTALETLKKSTNKSTNKIIEETALNSILEELISILSTNTLTNNQPTNNQQITNNQPHRNTVNNDNTLLREKDININNLYSTSDIEDYINRGYTG